MENHDLNLKKNQKKNLKPIHAHRLLYKIKKDQLEDQNDSSDIYGKQNKSLNSSKTAVIFPKYGGSGNY